MKLTTHHHLISKLRMCVTVLPLPIYHHDMTIFSGTVLYITFLVVADLAV